MLPWQENEGSKGWKCHEYDFQYWKGYEGKKKSNDLELVMNNQKRMQCQASWVMKSSRITNAFRVTCKRSSGKS